MMDPQEELGFRDDQTAEEEQEEQEEREIREEVFKGLRNPPGCIRRSMRRNRGKRKRLPIQK